MGSDVKVTQDLSCLVGEEMAQPHTERALALGGNFTPAPFTPLGLGLSALDVRM